jgi:hypothetical protein
MNASHNREVSRTWQFWVVAKQAYLDLYRERIFYNVILVGLFLTFVGYLSSLLVFGYQDRVMMSLGTAVMSITVLVLSATLGAKLIRDEVESRNIYLPLTRPLSRTLYFWARIGGVALFLLSNLVLFLILLQILLHIAGGPWKSTVIQWAVLTWMESLIVLGLTVLLSLFLRPGLNLLCTLAFVFFAHNHGVIQQMEAKGGKNPILSALQTVTFDGNRFLLDSRIYYEASLSALELSQRVLYGLLWFGVLATVARLTFRQRNL